MKQRETIGAIGFAPPCRDGKAAAGAPQGGLTFVTNLVEGQLNNVTVNTAFGAFSNTQRVLNRGRHGAIRREHLTPQRSRHYLVGARDVSVDELPAHLRRRLAPSRQRIHHLPCAPRRVPPRSYRVPAWHVLLDEGRAGAPLARNGFAAVMDLVARERVQTPDARRTESIVTRTPLATSPPSTGHAVAAAVRVARIPAERSLDRAGRRRIVRGRRAINPSKHWQARSQNFAHPDRGLTTSSRIHACASLVPDQPGRPFRNVNLREML